MKSPKMPAAPDPVATAAAQTQSNKDTANYTQGLNMVNQVTPYGNLTYSGTNNGQPGSATATQTLAPAEQQALDQQRLFDSKTNQLAINQTDKLSGILDKPVDLNNEATEARLYDLGSKRLNPRFAQQKQDLEQNLMDRGIRPGSAAYETLHRQQSEGENDAYNQLALTGRAQAVQEALTERNQPINEITGLMNGQQIGVPQFQNTPNTQMAGTDIAGITQSNYANQMGQYNAKQQQQNAMMGGLFGLGSAGLGMFKFSDARLKTDVRKVGELDNGLGVYSYRYKAGGPSEIGLIAQEVERTNPDAVANVGGYKAVDYTAATEV